MSAMTPGLRVRLLLRRFTRRHPRLNSVIRAFLFFTIAFSTAFGFVTGARSQDYNPHTFAVGVAFLFAVACTALAVQNMRFRWLRRHVRKISTQNEALADRNWELKDAEERARHLFEALGDFVVRRRSDGAISFVNDAFCQLAGRSREELVGSSFQLDGGRAGTDRHGSGRHACARPEDRPALGRLARKPDPPRRQCAGGTAVRRPRRHRPHRGRADAGARPRSGRRRQPRQVAVPGDGEPRDPHAAERHHRHERPVARLAAFAGTVDLCPRHQDVGRCTARIDRGDPRLLQDRSRPHRPRMPPLPAAPDDRGGRRVAGAARAGQAARTRRLCRRRPARRRQRRRRAAATGAAESRRQCHQVHDARAAPH